MTRHGIVSEEQKLQLHDIYRSEGVFFLGGTKNVEL